MDENRTDPSVAIIQGHPPEPPPTPLRLLADSSPKFKKNLKRPRPASYTTHRLTPSDIEKFWSEVTQGRWDECWLWKGPASEGYGYWSRRGRSWKVHRLAFELRIGPIPEGLTIDHVANRGCKSKLCCNPNHLEAVTLEENFRRYRATLSPTVQCPLGHAPRKRGSGDCKKCRVIAVRRSQGKNPEKYLEMKREQKRKERARKKAGL